MVKLEKLIGDIIYISFRDIGRYKDIGITQHGHYKLKGYDQLGLWLEHPGIIIKKIIDEKDSPIPLDQQKKEIIQSDFMAHWDNVNSLMQYPERVGFDFNDTKSKIGFKLVGSEEK